MSDEPNQLRQQRLDKLAAHRAAGNAFPNTFRPDDKAAALRAAHGEKDKATLEEEGVAVSLAGRIMTRRIMGKASFADLRDVSGNLQLFFHQGTLGDAAYDAFKDLDLGDIIGVEGLLFLTKTGELSVRVQRFELLVKSLRPLPEKFHGIADPELRYRQRYVDLIVSDETREIFRRRSAIIRYIRDFFIAREFLEVETPMMQVIPGGAAARPFVTHHNALDIDLYLRIAPELFLKRLVVGGFERVFEINRNFRNEGLSARHNPEFTMLEFYWAYADYEDLMDLTEELLRGLAESVTGSPRVPTEDGESTIDFAAPFRRVSLFDAIVEGNEDIAAGDIDNLDGARAVAERLKVPLKPEWTLGKVQTEIFEATVEHTLLAPTFITRYPTEVSPLSRRNDADPSVTDRFELFIDGREIANGFSELNDAVDQAERFEQQVAEKEAGDAEAMHYDADYVRALEYGMPPTAGEGIGIDRLVMLLTASPSIREVILFPHMRPEVDQ
ncbi:MAG: lysine--tRNA ligase [Gammaproteobacteria bacterium]|nr:MAG: lysine--tRNA ligase [Gammaproteobacteria bacterium]PIE37861.1 MAG: lysine--tRNA ligase [Gammaproteobacteria bacterium]